MTPLNCTRRAAPDRYAAAIEDASMQMLLTEFTHRLTNANRTYAQCPVGTGTALLSASWEEPATEFAHLVQQPLIGDERLERHVAATLNTLHFAVRRLADRIATIETAS